MMYAQTAGHDVTCHMSHVTCHMIYTIIYQQEKHEIETKMIATSGTSDTSFSNIKQKLQQFFHWIGVNL